VVSAEIQSDLPIDKLREADIQMAENFLARRYELPNRVDLAMKIQKALYNRMDIVLSPFLPATEYEKRIQEVVSAYRAREGSNL
jgi:hypothetical protein